MPAQRPDQIQLYHLPTGASEAEVAMTAYPFKSELAADAANPHSCIFEIAQQVDIYAKELQVYTKKDSSDAEKLNVLESIKDNRTSSLEFKADVETKYDTQHTSLGDIKSEAINDFESKNPKANGTETFKMKVDAEVDKSMFFSVAMDGEDQSLSKELTNIHAAADSDNTEKGKVHIQEIEKYIGIRAGDRSGEYQYHIFPTEPDQRIQIKFEKEDGNGNIIPTDTDLYKQYKRYFESSNQWSVETRKQAKLHQLESDVNDKMNAFTDAGTGSTTSDADKRDALNASHHGQMHAAFLNQASELQISKNARIARDDEFESDIQTASQKWTDFIGEHGDEDPSETMKKIEDLVKEWGLVDNTTSQNCRVVSENINGLKAVVDILKDRLDKFASTR